MPKSRTTADTIEAPVRKPGRPKAVATSAAKPDAAAPGAKPARRGAAPKAGRPDLVPLDEHLAALLNPALNEPRAPAAVADRDATRGGFAEAPQARFEPAPAPRDRATAAGRSSSPAA